jgi:hypothetical protein
MAELRIYADFNDLDGDDVCCLLLYQDKPLEPQAEVLGIHTGMPVVVFYEDESEEFEFDAILLSEDDRWMAKVDGRTYRLIRETPTEVLREKGIIP